METVWEIVLVGLIVVGFGTSLFAGKITKLQPVKVWWSASERQYQALVAEARSNWRIVKKYENECMWVTRDGSIKTPAGVQVFFAEENDLGERRVRVIHKPRDWRVEDTPLYARLKSWAASGELRMPPRKEREIA